MNSLIIVIITLVCFFWGYRFYARKLEFLWGIDPKRSTPAYAKYDNVDYIPAKNWLVLFGHHFASIAGAGPIVGPVLACVLWGWLPTLLWVVMGTIFIGAVHDFGALIISVREGGSSVADIAQRVISHRAKILFSLFVWLALILVIAVFTYFCADTFIKEPKIILPSLGLIPIAMMMGYLLYHLRMNNVLATIFGLVSLVGLIRLGNSLPINSTLTLWLGLLLVYCYFASVLPVNLLLQPRDYLSSYLLFFGVICGFLGLFIQHPNIQTPAYIKFNSSEGLLWPMMCVTVACGAVSGFHSLIASGTTSKQLANERYAKRIGYGGMVAEGIVAILAILSVCSGLTLTDICAKANPITLFAQGFGNITKSILAGFGGFIAATILNAFILTTLDTATRICRYLSEELFKIKNRYISTLLVVLAVGLLIFSKDGSGKPLCKKIWLLFGVSNQLVAALTLFVITAWLFSQKKSTRFILPIAIFMSITTILSLTFQIIKSCISKQYILFVISLLLFTLAMLMIWEVFSKPR